MNIKFNISNFIARLPIPYSFWLSLEKIAVYCKGQGYNSTNNIVHEVNCISSMVKGEVPIILYDIGANRGQYSAAFLTKFKSIPVKVHMFEPEPTLFKKLQNIYASNSQVILSEKALSDKSGLSIFRTTVPGALYGSLVNRDTSRYGFEMNTKWEVKTIRFDEYCNDEMIQELGDLNLLKILKMDVEGHEMSVLKGMGKHIKKIDILQFEFGHCHIDSRTFFKDFWDYFNKESFSLYLITPRGLQKYEEYSDRFELFLTTNYLAVNNNSKLLTV